MFFFFVRCSDPKDFATVPKVSSSDLCPPSYKKKKYRSPYVQPECNENFDVNISIGF